MHQLIRFVRSIRRKKGSTWPETGAAPDGGDRAQETRHSGSKFGTLRKTKCETSPVRAGRSQPCCSRPLSSLPTQNNTHSDTTNSNDRSKPWCCRPGRMTGCRVRGDLHDISLRTGPDRNLPDDGVIVGP